MPADSTIDRLIRMLRGLEEAERVEAIAYLVAGHLELEDSDMPGGLEQLLAELHTRVREIQARAAS